MESRRLTNNMVRTQRLNPAKNAGFTLIELMVVVAIIGIVAGLAITNFRTLNKQMDFDAQYQHLKSSVQRCRSQALQYSHPTTSPTAIVLFTNGYACIRWMDDTGAGISKLGTASSINMGSNGILDVGEANGEVLAVYFQTRYDPSFALNGLPTTIRMNSAASSGLQSASVQGDGTGYTFIYASGGYILGSDWSKLTPTIVLTPLEGLPSQFTMYTSGQMVGR